MYYYCTRQTVFLIAQALQKIKSSRSASRAPKQYNNYVIMIFDREKEPNLHLIIK